MMTLPAIFQVQAVFYYITQLSHTEKNPKGLIYQ